MSEPPIALLLAGMAGLAVLPALLPLWRPFLIGSAVFAAALVAVMTWALADLGEPPRGSDGPAFAGMMLLLGLLLTLYLFASGLKLGVRGLRALRRWLRRPGALS